MLTTALFYLYSKNDELNKEVQYLRSILQSNGITPIAGSDCRTADGPSQCQPQCLTHQTGEEPLIALHNQEMHDAIGYQEPIASDRHVEGPHGASPVSLHNSTVGEVMVSSNSTSREQALSCSDSAPRVLESVTLLGEEIHTLFQL